MKHVPLTLAASLLAAAAGRAATYYVNDGSIEGDVYCTAAGDDANSGLLSSAPVATPSLIFERYDLEPGDTVYIETGTYLLDRNIHVGASDGGTAGAPVRIHGAPPGSGRMTLLDRGSQAGGAFAIEVYRTASVAIEDLDLRSGWISLRLDQTPDVAVRNVSATGAGSDGVFVYSCARATLDRINSHHNGRNGIGCEYPESLTLTASRVWSNGEGGVAIGQRIDGFVRVLETRSHSTTARSSGCPPSTSRSCRRPRRATTPSWPGALARGASRPVLISISVDYNDLHVEDGATVAASISVAATLQDWRAESGQESHSFGVDRSSPAARPAIPSPEHGGALSADGAWATDPQDSPCIDTGDPASPFGPEPAPNGGRVNLGAHGNTAQASRSSGRPWLAAVSLSQGLIVGDAVTTYWYAGRVAADDTVRVEYSPTAAPAWTGVAAGILPPPGSASGTRPRSNPAPPPAGASHSNPIRPSHTPLRERSSSTTRVSATSSTTRGARATSTARPPATTRRTGSPRHAQGQPGRSPGGLHAHCGRHGLRRYRPL